MSDTLDREVLYEISCPKKPISNILLKKFLISEGEDGWLVVECPSIPGCISQGKTVEDAMANIKEAIEGCLEVMEERVLAKEGKRVMEVVV